MAGRDYVRFDLRQFIHADHLEVAKVFLDRGSVSEINLAVEGCGKCPGNPAFHLSVDTGRIDDQSAIGRADDSMDTNIASLTANGNIRHLRHV